jgi:recombinational DNA repair protein RecR
MKSAIAALFFMAASAHAHTYHCNEIVDDVGSEVLRARTSVVVEEVADISDRDRAQRYDSVYQVNVKILSTLRGRTTLEKTFSAIATDVDVDYTVNAVKAQGVKIAIFQDEEADAWMEETLADGHVVTTRLYCK